MLKRFARHLAGPCVVAAMTVLGPAAQASPFDAMTNAYQCVKDAGMGSVSVMVDVAQKGALIAEIGANASACTAAAGGTSVPYAATLAAISAIKVASPETVPTGKCESSVKGVVARPFGEGISYIIPPSSIRTKLIEIVNSETAQTQMWSAIETIPGVQPYTVQVGCACTTIDNGIALTDMRAVGDAISQTSASCASMLDSMGLGFINDLDDAAEELARETYSSLSGTYDELISGETDPKPYGVVYDEHFATGRAFFIHRFALQGAGAEPIVESEVANRIGNCATYYDEHKHSYSNGKKICTEMANRLKADVKAEGMREFNESMMLKEIGEKWDKLFETNWAWRLPVVAKSNFPIDDSAGRAAKLANYTVGDLKHPDAGSLKTLAGGLDCTGVKSPVVRARCASTGIYAAARQGWAYAADKDMAIKLAQAGVAPKMSAWLVNRWNANRVSVREYYLWWWATDAPAMSGQWGCPANEPMRSACVEDQKASFDKGCFDTMRDAVAYAPSSASIVFGPVAKSISTCQSLLKRRVKFANELAAQSVDMSPGSAIETLCGTYGDRTSERQICSDLVIKGYETCALKAMEAGFTVSQPGGFKSCWSEQRKTLKENLPTLVAARSGRSVSPVIKAPDTPVTQAPVIKLPPPNSSPNRTTPKIPK